MIKVDDHLWTSKELAEKVGLDQSRIRQLLLKGVIDGFKVSNRWFIRDSEVKRWLEERQPITE